MVDQPEAPTDRADEFLRMLRNLGDDAPYRAARNGEYVGVVSRTNNLVQMCGTERDALVLALQLNLMCGAQALPVRGPCSPWRPKGAMH